MSCKVIICDAGAPWRLVIRDVAGYQGTGVEAYMPNRMPVAKTENNTFSIKYIHFFYLCMLVFLYKWFLRQK